MATRETFSIGELASRAGITPDAVRYYERLGLVSRAPRTSGGFRVYTTATVERLRFVKQAQTHGLTLAEIRDLLRLENRRGADQCRHVSALLQRKLIDVDVRLAELQEFRRMLDGYLHQCNRTLLDSPDASCPVVERLHGGAK